MEEAKTRLTDRNLSQAGKNQDMAMEGLNEATLGLFNSMQNMTRYLLLDVFTRTSSFGKILSPPSPFFRVSFLVDANY